MSGLLLRVDLSSLLRREGDVDNSGAGNDVVIGDRVTNLRNNGVDPAVSDILRNGNGVTITDLGVVNVETSKESSVLTGLNTVTGDGNLLTTADVAGNLGGGESLDGESGVGVRAAGDEGSSERVGLVEVERSAEVTREAVTLENRRSDPACGSETKSKWKEKED